MIELYTSPTPNGHKISIALEEMSLKYEVKPIDLSKGEQKNDKFLAICPNGRIPAIVDKDRGDFAVFESGATFPWVNIHEWSGVEISDLKNLSAWVERCRERLGFKAGLEVPIRLTPPDPEEAKKAAQNIIQK